MSEYTYHDLKQMTVAQLREVCAGVDDPAVQGYTQLHKADVILMLCEAFGIDPHEHHEVVGVDSHSVKAQIAGWKVKRQAALEAGDHEQLKFARTKIRRLKRKIRRAMV